MSSAGKARRFGSARVAGGTADKRQERAKVLLSSPRQLPVSQQSSPGAPHVVPLNRHPVRGQNRPAHGVGTQIVCVAPAATSHPLPSGGSEAHVWDAVEQNSVAAQSAFETQARVLAVTVPPSGMNVHCLVIAESQYWFTLHSTPLLQASLPAIVFGRLPTAPIQSVAPHALCNVTVREPGGHLWPAASPRPTRSRTRTRPARTPCGYEPRRIISSTSGRCEFRIDGACNVE